MTTLYLTKELVAEAIRKRLDEWREFRRQELAGLEWAGPEIIAKQGPVPDPEITIVVVDPSSRFTPLAGRALEQESFLVNAVAYFNQFGAREFNLTEAVICLSKGFSTWKYKILPEDIPGFLLQEGDTVLTYGIAVDKTGSLIIAVHGFNDADENTSFAQNVLEDFENLTNDRALETELAYKDENYSSLFHGHRLPAFNQVTNLASYSGSDSLRHWPFKRKEEKQMTGNNSDSPKRSILQKLENINSLEELNAMVGELSPEEQELLDNLDIFAPPTQEEIDTLGPDLVERLLAKVQKMLKDQTGPDQPSEE